MISVNDREWGAFGDVIINVFYKEKSTIYAIQCKRINKTARQITCLEEAKLYMEKQYDKITELKFNGKDFNEIRFVIFTTCRTSTDFCKTFTLPPRVLNKWKTTSQDVSIIATVQLKPLKKNDIINVTGEAENIYSFLLMENIECQLPHFFFYTSQRVTPTMLNQLLKLKFDNYPDISNDYTKYIESWGEGKLGGNYKLRKKDVILKIGEILLNPYTVTPKKVQSKHDSFDVWNSVIDQMDLTVVKNEPFTISKICQPLNKIIEQTLRINIDTITKSINLKKGNQSVLDSIKDPIKSYLFEVVQNRLMDDIPLHLVYVIFWKAGKIPLLLSSENQEDRKGFILDIILFMKQMGVNKKFLLKSADLNLTRYKGNLKIFTCLDDIKYLVNLDELNIRVSDTFNLSLSILHSNDPFFFKWVNSNIFFDIALGKYSLKASYYTNRKQKNDDLKIILSDEVKEQLENSLYAQNGLLRLNSKKYKTDRLRDIDPCLF
ncbi:hypothetical protein NQ314_020148 [Rhamnusium bicolor]|uniref:Uncharacterized protein n=1 Tax=Rhamnusium bicolor TaxID=1586634 RepID=A0AAV8WLU8_9CUCU|nr:hypothetical protein NQ314_020148 [Rhamnusium bicolor]